MKIEPSELWAEEAKAQFKYIESCGGSVEGYNAHFGSINDKYHLGRGGEEIYAADVARLVVLITRANPCLILAAADLLKVAKESITALSSVEEYTLGVGEHNFSRLIKTLMEVVAKAEDREG